MFVDFVERNRFPKGATSRTTHLEKTGVFSSLSFTIRLNLGQSKPSLVTFAFSLLCCFSSLQNYYFEIFFNLEVIRKNDLTYRDIAPLNETNQFLQSAGNISDSYYKPIRKLRDYMKHTKVLTSGSRRKAMSCCLATPLTNRSLSQFLDRVGEHPEANPNVYFSLPTNQCDQFFILTPLELSFVTSGYSCGRRRLCVHQMGGQNSFRS